MKVRVLPLQLKLPFAAPVSWSSISESGKENSIEYKNYLGKVISVSLAARIWDHLQDIKCYKSWTYVDGGCIIEIA
ncbi:MAG: hypothetical protein IKG47_04485 [Oscillospiraceae bacterium]|nr:hypothetical protein [Oscillospiraceae bacterium]